MKLAFIIAVIGIVVGAAAIAPPPGAAQTFHMWSRGLGDSAFDQVAGVALDDFGNVFAAGSFQGTVDFGGGNMVSAGERDVFLVKYAPDGTHLWSQRFGDADVDIVHALAVDALGNVVIVGGFRGSIDFGGGGGGIAAGINDVFIAKFAPNGAPLWANVYGSTQHDYALAVAIDASGNVIVTGGFHGTVDFGGGGLVSAGDLEAFFAKYDANGAHQWSQRFGGTGSDVGTELAADASGDIVFGGLFSNTVDFGGGSFISAGQVDMILAKYDASGAHQWSQAFGSATTESMEGVSIGATGDICITGSFENTVDFGGGGIVSAGASDVVLARYTSAGSHLWSQGFGGVDYDRGYALDRDASGNIVLTGRFMVSIDFGGGTRVSPGAGDGFIAEFDTAGTYVSDEHFGTSVEENARSIVADAFGGIVVMGYFAGTLDFGGGPIVSAGSDDIFVVRFADGVEGPLITSIVDVDNDEGREVRVTFDRSVHDDPASATQVTTYEIYRRDDPVPSAIAIMDDGLQRIEGWTFVASAPAHGELSYNMLAPTIGDSTVSGGQYTSVFFVRAATNAPTILYDSAPDSGYSLDNLAPPAPSNVAYNTGTLTWEESGAFDFDYFSVYGSNVNDFGSATTVGRLTATGLDVSGSPFPYYFVTATDFAGNESGAGTPGTVIGIGATPTRRGLSVAAHPNPFNPSTTIKFTVPSRGPVRIAIYDARGKHVTTLVNQTTYAAGDYTMPWNGRDRSGNGASSGVYFLRIDHGGSTHARKLVLLK